MKDNIVKTACKKGPQGIWFRMLMNLSEIAVELQELNKVTFINKDRTC